MNQSKKNILDKAFHLFLNKSYDSVSMREIQETAKTSRGAIYHHFSSKEEIYELAIKNYLLPAFSSYSVTTDEDKKTLLNTIYSSIKSRQSHVSILKEITNSSITDYDFFRFVFQATEHNEHFKEEANWIVERDFNAWRLSIQAAMRIGEIRSDLELDFVAQYFVSSPLGLGNLSAFNKYIHTDIKDVRSIYLKFYNLLMKKPF